MSSRYICSVFLSLFLAICSAAAQPAVWTSTGIGGGGAFYQPSFSPHSPSELYVCSDMTDLFHTTTLGQSWELIHFREFQGGNSRGLVQFTSNPQIVYGINAANDQGIPSVSNDGGHTWSPLASDPTGGGAYALYADPASTQNILVSDYTTVWYSTDGGSTFTQKFSSNVNGAGCHIAGVFFDPAAIVVGTNAGVYASTNGGASFSVLPLTGIPSDERIVSFAGGRTGATARFFCVTLGVNDVYPGVTGAEYANYKSVYAITLGQPAWTDVGATIMPGEYPFFVAMSRNSADIAYLAGGSDLNAPVIHRTSNGGAAWLPVFKTLMNQNISTGWCGQNGDRGWSFPEYALGLAVAPMNPDVVALTDLGCVHVTANGGTSWQQAYVAPADQNPPGNPTPPGRNYHGVGLEDTGCWSLCWADSLTIFAGVTDIRGMLSEDAGASWTFGYTGHTQNTMYHAIKHPTTGTLYAATSSVHDMYQSTYLQDTRIDIGAGLVLMSLNKGRTWTTMRNFAHPVIWLALDPAHPNRMYASVIHSTQGGIFVSDNIQNGAAATWTKLANPPRTEGHPYNIMVLNDGTLLCTYSGRRAGSPLAFTASSGVFTSSNGGTSWVDRSGPSLLYWTHDVVVDPTDPAQNTWYAGVYNGWGGPPNGLGGLYKTTDRGGTWTRVLTKEGITSCTFRPNHPTELYITTEQDGLWMCANTAAPIPVYSEVASYPFKQPQRVFFNPYKPGEMWVTSFGGGLRYGAAPIVPVELSAFSAREEQGLVVLEWETASETGNAGFSIERASGKSGGDDSWSGIGYIAGKGTSMQTHAYRWVDHNPLSLPVSRYRLRQRDWDGKETVSNTVIVERASEAVPAIVSVSPQPFTRDLRVELSTSTAADARLALVDMLGREVPGARVRASSDARFFTIETVSLPAGPYLLLLRTMDGVLSRMVMKQD